jgi:hypothetical protein
MSVSRKWVFTINNYTEADCERIRDWAALDECLGISAGLEVGGKSGTAHIQGYLIAGKATRKTYFYTKFRGDKSCKFWMDVPRGDWEQNAKYTTKDENVLVWKVPPESEAGRRMDLEDFHEALKRKPEMTSVELAESGHLGCLAKYPRLRNELRTAYLKEQTREFRRVEVHVRFGAAGSGKTREPYEEGAYIFDDYEGGWWDGYDGESVVLLDDFYGGIKWSFFLRLLDGYQVRLKIKGGFTWAKWTKIYITSNKPPSEWYARGCPPELERRITSVKEFA